MIGDWIKIKIYGVSDKYERAEAYIYVKVAEIGSGLITVEYNNNIKEPYRICENTEIEPILLTSEVLEKNGFKRDPLWHHCDKDLDNYSISVQLGYANRIEYIKIAEKGKDNVIPSERTKLYLTHIKYVHELQHALRLCGIEKEIIL